LYSVTTDYPGIGGPTNHRLRIQLYDDAACGEPDDFTIVQNPAPLTINQADADLALTKTASDETVAPGQTLTYTITATNGGPDPVPNGGSITILDTLPQYVVFVSADPGCVYNIGPHTVTCVIPLPTGLAVSASVSRQVTVTVGHRGGLLTNEASITDVSLLIDPNSENNSAQQSTAVIPTMTEWGMIIFMLLAGFGSVYFIRRKRA
jgi:uncharacterized repeat protein (TIGR01451 family)